MFVQVSPDSVAAAGETVGLSNLPGNKQTNIFSYFK